MARDPCKRLVSVTLNADSLATGNPDQEHERAVAIYQDHAYGTISPKRRPATGADGGPGPLGKFHRERVESAPGHA